MPQDKMLKEASSYFDFFQTALNRAASAALAEKNDRPNTVTVEQHLADALDHWKSYVNLKKRARL